MMPILGRSAGSHLGLDLGLGVGRLLGFIEGYIFIHFSDCEEYMEIEERWGVKRIHIT